MQIKDSSISSYINSPPPLTTPINAYTVYFFAKSHQIGRSPTRRTPSSTHHAITPPIATSFPEYGVAPNLWQHISHRTGLQPENPEPVTSEMRKSRIEQ
jgi:hypothetical protein